MPFHEVSTGQLSHSFPLTLQLVEISELIREFFYFFLLSTHTLSCSFLFYITSHPHLIYLNRPFLLLFHSALFSSSAATTTTFVVVVVVVVAAASLSSRHKPCAGEAQGKKSSSRTVLAPKKREKTKNCRLKKTAERCKNELCSFVLSRVVFFSSSFAYILVCFHYT